jgi:hypothetical protein
MKSRRLVPALVGSSILSILPCGLISQDRTQPQCSVSVASVSLTGDTDIEESIGNLTFEMKALKGASGWLLSLQDAYGHDLICPVNNPIPDMRVRATRRWLWRHGKAGSKRLLPICSLKVIAKLHSGEPAR